MENCVWGGGLLFSLSMSLTSCDPYLDDVLGEWSRPTPVTPTVNPDVTPEPPANPMLAVPLTLEVTTAGTIIVDKPRSGMQYSLNGGAKTPVPAGTAINGGDLNVGDKVQFYGNGTSIKSYCTSNTDFTKITGGTAKVKVFGNIMSLVDEEGFADNKKLTADNTFYWLFNTSELTDASGLLLPATTLTDYCYSGIFKNCFSLTTVPEKLPAESLASNCYKQMFNGCNKLTTAPELPAENLAPNCYEMMFSDCISLTTAPELPAKILIPNCYQKMFTNCKALTTAYVKAAYTTTNDECSDMFDGCTAAGAKTLHTTNASKGSWETAITNESWAGWTAVDDWND